MHHRRGPWSAHEDAHLLGLVQVHGPHNWVRISQLVTSRSPKQCRERYHQNLKPTLNHEPITPEEGVLIERLVGEMGKRWAEIARRLHGRSDNAVKNWWNGGMNRRKRLCLRQRGHSQGSDGHSDEHSSPYSTSSRSSIGLRIDVSRRDDDDPLVSPSFSEMSGGQTPSLASDSTSTFSTSPRLPASPMSADNNTLPPLLVGGGGGHCAQRRQSLPILHLPDPHVPDYIRSPGTCYSLFEHPYESPQDYHYLRHKVSAFGRDSDMMHARQVGNYPPHQVYMNQFGRRDSVAIRDPESMQPMQPDHRMNLASILG